VSGKLVHAESGEAVAGATISLPAFKISVASTSSGSFRLQVPDSIMALEITAIGFEKKVVALDGAELLVRMQPLRKSMDEVVVTGTMRAVQRSASPVPVEVYTPVFFRKNPSPSIFDALQMVNGVRPQLNCNVCNTGDIHINGLEGPYTMVLIDGMPIVSSLASVYGLQGIPNSLVERIEIVKGPASSLYGSEAIGGLINVITKHPRKAPAVSVEYSGTSWREHNLDAGFRFATGKKSQSLLGISYYNFTHRYDENRDNFTDVTLQNRISLFQKISWQRKENRQAAVAVRVIAEDRWGGEMQWTRKFRGGDSVYGEQITTTRGELIGNYQLPVPEKIMFSFSANAHRQRSAYGNTIFDADQRIGFGQFTWEKDAGSHQLLSGIVGRYTWYDDNTPATASATGAKNSPDKIFLPGIFIQDEWQLHSDHLLLTGLRYDYDKRHGNIITPRIAWKWTISEMDHLRLNAGSGFRVVNLFTEDHAALTGARKVEIVGSLKPEKSYNVNLNYSRKFVVPGGYLNLEAATWYTYFTNRIIPDYTSDPDKIIYSNLDGYAESKGFSINMEAAFRNRLRLTTGFTLQDVSITNRDAAGKTAHSRQLLTEPWSGTWTVSYTLGKGNWMIDYTGNLYGPMLLPLLGPTDPRPEKSPVWSIQNVQLTYKGRKGIEWFGGVKNLLNFTPARNTDFIIARAHDPFDKKVEYGTDGKVVATPENPNGLTFDPNYVYAPNQGRKLFFGLRYTWKGRTD
jgi:outer membrane receptor for ferrienterochelin and colicins